MPIDSAACRAVSGKLPRLRATPCGSIWRFSTMLRSPRQRRSYFVSPADPAARWTGANGGLAFFAYCTNYLIDLKRAVIVDVEATTAVRQPEVRAQQRMIDRTQERFDYGRNGWRPTAPTVRQRTSLGWFMSDGS